MSSLIRETNRPWPRQMYRSGELIVLPEQDVPGPDHAVLMKWSDLTRWTMCVNP